MFVPTLHSTTALPAPCLFLFLLAPLKGGDTGRVTSQCLGKLGRSIASFPGGSDGKVSACNAGDPGSIPGLGRSPGEGNVYPLQFSCLENPMDRGTW